MVSPEMELFDQLECGPMKYAMMEEHVFCSDRGHMLRSLSLMSEAGLIAVDIDGQAVPRWKIESWRRQPQATETSADLGRVMLWMTDKGFDWYVKGIKVD